MIRIIGKIPRNVTIACSGGIDSMVFTHFLQQGKRNIKLAYFNHDTVHSRNSEEFVKQFAEENKIKLFLGKMSGTKGRRSIEEFWRDERYKFFDNLDQKFVITCHHLDDCVETWLMSSIHGQSKLIPYKRNNNVYRPFLMTTRSDIEKYAENKGVNWIEDPSNKKTSFMRNHVRHNMMPLVLKVNPGIRSMIRKKIVKIYS